MNIDTAHVQFWLTILLTVVVPLLVYVLRNQEQRAVAREDLLKTTLRQHTELLGEQHKALHDEINTLNSGLRALVKHHVDAIQREVTALQEETRSHRQWLDKLSESLHNQQVILARDYPRKDEQNAELRAIETRLDRVHDTLHGGLKEIAERLQRHEIKEATNT